MTVFRLSPLDMKTGALVAPTAPGRWSPIPSLHDVAASLSLNLEQVDLGKVKSVPDVWAQTLAFRRALFQFDHPAHSDAVTQWRGLLAVLGLRRIDESLRFSLTQIDLEELSEGADGGDFVRVAYELRPSTKYSLDDRLSWDRLWSISVDGADVGVLSAETLVAPVRTRSEIGANLPRWLQPAPGDPTEFERDPDRRAALVLFLQNIVRAVRANANAGKVVDLLDQYISDLGVGAASLAAEPRKTEDQIGNFPDASLFTKFNTVWEKGEVKGAASDAFIEVPERLSDLIERVVIADKGVAKSLGIDPAHLILWNRWRFSDLNDMAAIREHAFRYKKGCLVVTKDDLFSPALAPVPSASITGHGGGVKSKAILPLTPLALLLFGASRLASDLSLREESSDRWIASLKLKLKRNDGTAFTHTLTREYVLPGSKSQLDENPGLLMRDRSGEVTTELPMTLGAWPDFVTLHWRWNFLYFYTDFLTAAVPTSGVSVAGLKQDIVEIADAGERWARLKSWGTAEGRWAASDAASIETTAGGRAWFDRIRISRGQAGDNEKPDQELQRSDYSFEAVAMTVYPELFGFPDDIGPMHVGLALLPAPHAPQSSAEDRAEIAIDFGTTNTTVYKRHRGQKEHVSFAKRLRTLVAADDSAGAAHQRADLFAAFFPARSVTPPFMTVMQDRIFGGFEEYESLINKCSSPALWRDYVYFDQENANAISTIFEANKGVLHFGIKWSIEEKERRRIHRFLRQVGLMTAAELAFSGVRPQDIAWNFSFPEAMSDSDINSFKTISRKVADEVRRSSIEASDVDGKAEVEFYTESQAAAMEFLNSDGPRPAMLVVLDIGGGTTDVSVWSGDHQIWRDSFQLAGRQLIVEFIVRNRRFLEQLNGLEKLLSNAENRRQFMSEPADNDRLVNAAAVLINSPDFAKIFDENFAHVAGSPAGQKLQAGALLALGGLMYFIGLQIRGLRSDPSMGVIRDNNLETMTVGFAGRGATIFKLFKAGDDGEVGVSLKRVLNLFAEGAGLERSDIKAHFSRDDKVKHEVASGMLPMKDAEVKELKSEPLSRETVLGELIEGVDVTGAAVSLETPLASEARLHELSAVGPVVVNEFDKFLKVMEEKGGVRIKLAPSALTHLEVVTSQALQKVISRQDRKDRKDEDRFDPDPPFLIMLRETLLLLYRSGEGEQVTATLLD